jgi:hypothetical protein
MLSPELAEFFARKAPPRRSRAKPRAKLAAQKGALDSAPLVAAVERENSSREDRANDRDFDQGKMSLGDDPQERIDPEDVTTVAVADPNDVPALSAPSCEKLPSPRDADPLSDALLPLSHPTDSDVIITEAVRPARQDWRKKLPLSLRLQQP